MNAARAQALIVTQYYRPEMLGSGPFCADLAEWLTRRGRRVTVLAGPPHYPDATMFAGQRDQMARHEVINGVAVERVRSEIPAHASARARIAAELSFFLSGVKALLAGRIQRHSVVISLCPSVLSVALGAMVCRRDGHHVALVHDIQSGLAKGLGMVKLKGLAGIMRRAERAILNRADLVVVLTPEMAQELRGNGIRSAIEILPIWVDLNRFAPPALDRSGPLRILYSGNLGRKQGLGQIVELAALLQQSRPELSITIRGKGNQAEALRAEIRARNLNNIRFEDPLPFDAFHQGLSEADIHLVPQAPDAANFALPSKIYNIMAAGRPFVATAQSGSPLWRIHEKSQGFLCVPPSDPAAFARAVMTLADDAELRRRLGERGRRFVEENNERTKVLADFEASIDMLHAR